MWRSLKDNGSKVQCWLRIVLPISEVALFIGMEKLSPEYDPYIHPAQLQGLHTSGKIDQFERLKAHETAQKESLAED
jgi:hypothetical protein